MGGRAGDKPSGGSAGRAPIAAGASQEPSIGEAGAGGESTAGQPDGGFGGAAVAGSGGAVVAGSGGAAVAGSGGAAVAGSGGAPSVGFAGAAGTATATGCASPIGQYDVCVGACGCMPKTQSPLITMDSAINECGAVTPASIAGTVVSAWGETAQLSADGTALDWADGSVWVRQCRRAQ